MRKIKFISILLVLSMLLTVPAFAFSLDFTDVPEKAVYEESVSYRHREIPILELRLLARLKAEPKTITISSGENERTVEAEYIFHSPEGKAYIPRNWYEREYKPFMRALVKAHPKIPLLTPHELRHTRATLWSAQGVPQHLIADLLGHCDTRMLERVYNHTTTDTLSVFKLVQELLAPSGHNKKTGFQVLMDNLPSTHKARWFAGAALNTSEQGMASVMSTVLSRLNAFLDSELEQVLCFDSAIDAEHFAAEKSAIFLVLPEEDSTKNFMAGLMIQNLSRELFSVADEHGGKLQNRVVFYCDELGTMPPFDILPLFSAGRSRKLTLVPIIQSLAQLEKNYGKEGAEIIGDNCQDTIFGGFAPNSQTAETLSKALGSRTVLTGSVSKGKDNTSQSLQMAERALLSPDELKNLPKGNFIVMKTGTHPMRTKLQLYFKWGISFEEPYRVPERAQREVYYAGKEELLMNIIMSFHVSASAYADHPELPAASARFVQQIRGCTLRRCAHPETVDRPFHSQLHCIAVLTSAQHRNPSDTSQWTAHCCIRAE